MRNVILSVVAAVSLTATISSAQQTTVTTDTKVKSDNGKVVTMVGCVMIGGGTSFVLSNITTEREQDAAASSRARGPYALIGRDGLDLGPFIHQKVELTGVVVPPATKGDRDDKFKVEETTRADVDNGRDRKSRTATTVKVARGSMHQFLVASVKTLAPNCDS